MAPAEVAPRELSIPAPGSVLSYLGRARPQQPRAPRPGAPREPHPAGRGSARVGAQGRRGAALAERAARPAAPRAGGGLTEGVPRFPLPVFVHAPAAGCFLSSDQKKKKKREGKQAQVNRAARS